MDTGLASERNLLGDNDVNKVVKTYTRHWKWFLASIASMVVLALLYIRYATPQYASLAKIKILEEANASTPGMNIFQDLNLAPGANVKVEDEVETLNSRSNFIGVVNELGLNVKFYKLGNIRDLEMYGNYDLNLNFIGPDSLINESRATIQIDVISNYEFTVKEESEGTEGTYNFGETFKTSLGGLVITPNVKSYKSIVGKSYMVKVLPLNLVAEDYKRKTVISQSQEFSNILNLSLNDPIPNRGRDILQSLIDIYNENAIEDKKTIANKTSEFIDDRIAEIYSNLSEVEETAEDFQTDRGLADIATQSSLNLKMGSENRIQLDQLSTQLSIAKSMKDFVETQEGYDVLPSNIGLQDNSIAATTAKYNQLALERNRLLESSNEKNPIIANLDQQLDGLKRSLESSLSGMTNSLGMQVSNLESQASRINSQIYSAPRNQRALRDITRKQQTKESLYLYLLQKREESQIRFASTAPKSHIIDKAYSKRYKPVSPKIPIVLFASLIFGFILPFSVIYLNDLLDNKIHNKIGLEDMVKNVPILAEIPKIGKKGSKSVVKNDRSVLSESFRILRTNLDYIVKSKKHSQERERNIIFVTSSVPGEGKTILSSNLSMILSYARNKVLLIGADIRNPKIDDYYPYLVDKEKKTDFETDKGLSEYLFDYDVEVEDIIKKQTTENGSLDIIHSGKVPPNPTELLMGERMRDLFEKVSKKYDYVIVDTAPVIPVTDTLLISKYAHHVLYVVRAGVTEKKVLGFPIRLYAEGKLPNLAFVVNGVKDADLGYGGKYGYGYGEKTTGLKKVFKKS